MQLLTRSCTRLEPCQFPLDLLDELRIDAHVADMLLRAHAESQLVVAVVPAEAFRTQAPLFRQGCQVLPAQANEARAGNMSSSNVISPPSLPSLGKPVEHVEDFHQFPGLEPLSAASQAASGNLSFKLCQIHFHTRMEQAIARLLDSP